MRSVLAFDRVHSNNNHRFCATQFDNDLHSLTGEACSSEQILPLLRLLIALASNDQSIKQCGFDVKNCEVVGRNLFFGVRGNNIAILAHCLSH